ncbi:TetR/AcrR family transcriptional regulator [Nannocystis punicea]|uniref:TetR/AcrR family transcriptional regulator n=1 Tax=Nannocystis punicea TaxID=2995304 RepID=A0ABY7H7L8_9BACT|nr:TetR/AcrR family transcriptional regulator [Nannocystis poenicansa]WAS95262.1 TetR/AcrR family transcriptional regulator [Nannocystis poenicansa]
MPRQLAFATLSRMAAKRRIDPRRSPVQARSQATVDAVLQAAAYILVRDGYARLTTNRIAERAGVNIASLYQFFPNKEAIVVELERRHGERTDAAMMAALARPRGGGLESTLRALVEAYVAAQTIEPALQRVFTEEVPRLRGRRSATAGERCAADVTRFLSASGVRSPRLDLAGWMLATICRSVVYHGVLERQEDTSSGALVDEMVGMLAGWLRGDRPRAAT